MLSFANLISRLETLRSVQLDVERREGDCARIVFRPEDVSLSKTDFVDQDIIESAPHSLKSDFVGAYDFACNLIRRARRLSIDDESLPTAQTPESHQ